MNCTRSKDEVSGFTWLDFGAKPDPATIAALNAAGWRWGPKRKAWYTNRRWPEYPPGLVITDEGPVAYAAERPAALAEAADRAAARSTAAHDQASAIVDAIPLGQPILVGHHSERRHRKDLDRMGRLMDTAVEEQRKAEHLEYAAASSARHQAHKEQPGTIARRIKRLQAERTAYLNSIKHGIAYTLAEEVPRNDDETSRAYTLRMLPLHQERVAAFEASPRYQERMAGWAAEIARNEALLAEAGGLPVDPTTLAVGDRIAFGSWSGHFTGTIIRINKGRDREISSFTVECGRLGGSTWTPKVPVDEVQAKL